MVSSYFQHSSASTLGTMMMMMIVPQVFPVSYLGSFWTVFFNRHPNVGASWKFTAEEACWGPRSAMRGDCLQNNLL